MKNVLILSYFWPPAGGPGVQRPVKFAKYLSEFGWNPIILTVDNNQQFGYDESLFTDVSQNIPVYKNRIFLQKNQISGKSFTDDMGLKNDIKRWVRGNILLPDSRVFWYWQSRKTLASIFARYSIDLCFVTGPPQTTHLLGTRIKKLYNIPVVHDFRDPWTDAFFLKDFPRTRMAKWFDKQLERYVLSRADHVVSVSEDILKSLSLNASKHLITTVIENGFDSEPASAKPHNPMRKIIYTGTISDQAIPVMFLEFLAVHPELSLDIYGNVHERFVEKRNELKLQSQVNLYPFQPLKKIRDIQLSADILLLLIPNTIENKGILTGKLFEYLSANRPILGLGPTDGRSAEILEHSGIGQMFEYHDDPRVYFENFTRKAFEINNTYVLQFHRKKLTEKLANVFNSIKK